MTARDEALSGKLGVDERPGLLDALIALESCEADGVIVHRIDRLARELHVQEAALGRARAAGSHVEVYEAVDGAIKRDDPDDPMRTFVRQVMGASAQLERGLVRARLQGGRKRKAARGEWVGGHRLHGRYGYRVEDSKYVPVEAERVVIDRMGVLRAQGGTYRAIAAALTEECLSPPAGSAWHPATVRKILVREGRAAAQ